ncbi:MAG: histidinol-phosphate transaminase [Alphaproteobacteria bacterium]|uniref:Histidinol-phosphate aminotransferase n=1 Tax=Candidatus Nitrobium versatile TaxID=2884831 RepID=A0A953J7C2_9BACT|nr:histidinol-phosphate transaminase [Candidatus Nitrobium versatile]
MIQPCEYVAAIKPYVPGKPLSELERELGIRDSVKLASNENPLGPSPKALEAIKKYLLGEGDLHRYPDGGGYYLKQALCGKFASRGVKISPGELILGNGSNELLDIAVRTYMGPGDEAVMARPSFVVYAMSVQSVGAKAVEIPLTADYRHDLAKMADAVTPKTKMVFVANPNNPTGTTNGKDEFESFMEKIPGGVLVVLDEAYYEYVKDAGYPDTLRYFTAGREVLVLRTFSKAYGLAGLRLGYGIAKSGIITELNKIRAPFNTGTLAQIASQAALEDEEHLSRSLAVNEEGKQYLYRELDAMGVRYVPTETNFIYLPMEIESKEVNDALLRKGVIIRPAGPKEIRVTIGLPEENRRFIDAFRQFLAEHA